MIELTIYKGKKSLNFSANFLKKNFWYNFGDKIQSFLALKFNLSSFEHFSIFFLGVKIPKKQSFQNFAKKQFEFRAKNLDFDPKLKL